MTPDRPDRDAWRVRPRRWLPAAALFLALAPPARAIDLSGSFRGWTGSTDAAGIDSDEGDRTFRLALTQELTPWLTLFGSYRSSRFRTDFANLPDFERTSEQPEIGLSYDRTNLNARLLFSERAIRTTNENQDLDIQTLLASLDWRPTKGPRLGLQFEDSSSTADAVLVGRDTESRNLRLRADWSRSSWNARYSFELIEIENNVTGLRLEQDRHELRAGYAESLWDNRWSISLDARYADGRQTQDAPSGGAVALPVPATAGLFAVDATPALGELEPAPQLIDGDTTTPAAPGIEIGGANTFRNIGLDLGVSRSVSALEVTVDAPSGAVLWQIWTSPDNASWFQAGSAVSFFDGGFLRYTIRFPATTARFVKAVNVSVNPVLEASVTEVRALLETRQLERSEGTSDEYWVNLQSSLRPVERVEVSVGASVRRDQDLIATELRRDYDERGVTLQVRWDVTDRLELRTGYRVSELDENFAPVRQRREEVTTAVLDWRPLDTIGLLLTAQQREETDREIPVSSTDSLTLQAVTEIFPDLVVNSTLGWADTVDTLFGFSQETRYVVETVEARPNDRWLLAATLSHYEYDSAGRIAVTARTGGQLRAAWFATPFLTLSGEWARSDDDLGDTTTQRWGIQWAPGPKLSLSANYFETEASAGSGTANFSFDSSYRINRWIQLWAALNEAETLISTQQPATTETFRLGVNAVF